MKQPPAFEPSELELTEERLARVSVLQELTVAALALFDPAHAIDELLTRICERLGCAAALCLQSHEDGGLALLGAAGLSRASRTAPLPACVSGASPPAALPYPELAREGLVRWSFELPLAADERCWLLLYFAGEPQRANAYRGLVARLGEILAGALTHRRLYGRAIESERRLSEQKTLLECLSEASLDGALFVAADGSVSFNRRFAAMFQLPLGDALSTREIFRRLDRQITAPAGLADRLERMLGYREESCGGEMTLFDGRGLETSCVPVRAGDGTFFGRAFYFRDVTERHRAEEERARLLAKEQAARAQAETAERRAAFLADASRLLAASLDYEATLERVAHLALPDFADWCAVDIVEEDGTPRRLAIAHVDPAREELLYELRTRFGPDPKRTEGVGRVLATGRSVVYEQLDPAQLRAIAQSERHRELLEALGFSSAIMAPLTARGRLLGVVSLVYGPSGRRYRAEDLALAEELACRAALAVDNARLFFRMQEAVRTRDEFLSIASHELRTPITSLQLAAQGLLRAGNHGGASLAQPFVHTSLEVAVRQANRMAQLVDKLLDVSRIQAGRLELQLEEVDLAAVAREIVTQSSAELAQSSCSVQLQAGGPVVGRWDRGRIEQLVANLLSNAAKYGAGRPIEIAVAREGTLGRLTVTDHGIGIAPDQQALIFERFERAVSARHYSGLGLGLYIVKRVLDALGGNIRVESRPGEGSTFIVELPLEGPARGAETAGPAAARRGAA